MKGQVTYETRPRAHPSTAINLTVALANLHLLSESEFPHLLLKEVGTVTTAALPTGELRAPERAFC